MKLCSATTVTPPHVGRRCMNYAYPGTELCWTHSDPKPEKMRLWLLQRTGSRPEYDVVEGMVVRAHDEDSARRLAAHGAAYEGAGTWLVEKGSSCEVILANGEPGVLLTDCRAG